MNIIVTGAAGLIGSYLVEILEEHGNVVYPVDDLSFGSLDNCINFKSELLKLDLSKQETVSKLNDFNVDIICHLAAYKKAPKNSIASSDVMITNFKMMHNVIQIAESTGAKLLFTSTSDVYGNSETFSESDPITIGPPTNERYSYAMSKLHDEQLMLDKINEGDIKGSIARIFGCVSYRANKGWSGGHIPMFVWRALHNEDIFIHGDGKQTRSISHALDIAKGLVSMVNNIDDLNGEIYNIGTDQELSILDTAKYIIEKCNSKSNLIFQERNEVFGNYREIERRFANTEKAKKKFGYKVNYTTEEVIDEVIKVFKTQL